MATRGFGSDLAAIEAQMLTQIREFQAHGVAATVKHWPGEGYDDRDQHLVTTVNPLSMDEWERTFGRLYRAAIEAGVMSVMPGHIALPAFARSLGATGVDAFKPATVSRELTTVLLRERLGFNGIIVSDATPMAGLTSWGNREAAVLGLLNAGCDMILFSEDPEFDLAVIERGLKDGRLSQARVDDAVMRVLALKAAVGLHEPNRQTAEERLAKVGTPQNKAAARAVTQRAPTLVKDTQNLLPLDPAKHKRVLIVSSGIVLPFAPEPMPFALPDMLRKEGFEVSMMARETAFDRSKFDLVLYLFGEETLLVRSRIFADWMKLAKGGLHNAMARPWHDIPTAMISFGYPYYLYDAPRVPTYINAYATMDTMQAAVVECLLGRQPWNRHSPVDPFCGLEDARY